MEITQAAQNYRDALEAHRNARTRLSETLRDAQADGAKVRELMEWTGYSRRRIFQLLAKENER